MPVAAPDDQRGLPPRRGPGRARLRAGALLAIAIAGTSGAAVLIRRPEPKPVITPSPSSPSDDDEASARAGASPVRAQEVARIPPETSAAELNRAEATLQEPVRVSRLPEDQRMAVETFWHEAEAALTEAGVDLPRHAPPITSGNATALIHDHREFRERLFSAYRPLADLAREKVRLLTEYGVSAPAKDEELDLARDDPSTIWIASRSDGSERLVLKRGMYADLDRAHSAFTSIWRSRTSHYEQMLDYFATSH